MDQNQKPYVIGVMKTLVGQSGVEAFHQLVQQANKIVRERLMADQNLELNLFEFSGPHLIPNEGAYNPLDFLRLGLSEKLEREIDFLLILTEVDLSQSALSFALAYPSQLTNIGIISTKRLSPAFWGDPPDPGRTANRLAALMMHTLGHLFGLDHHPDPINILFDVGAVDDLDRMHQITPEQTAAIRRSLPRETHMESSAGSSWPFFLRQAWRNRRSIIKAVARANPLQLATKLPTMITAGLSVMIALFFAPEPWDIGSTVSYWQLALFVLLSLTAATLLLYQSFAFGTLHSRGRRISESVVVTESATLANLLATMLILYLAFSFLIFMAAVLVFPRELMATWPTVDPAVKVIDHIRLGLFLGGVGVLAGSLGGRADSQRLVRNVIFLDEET